MITTTAIYIVQYTTSTIYTKYTQVTPLYQSSKSHILILILQAKYYYRYWYSHYPLKKPVHVPPVHETLSSPERPTISSRGENNRLELRRCSSYCLVGRA